MLQAPSSVVHTSPGAQELVETHGAPPAPPAPLPPAPEPPAPVGSSGQVIFQTGRPCASIVQTGTVRPTWQAIAGIGALPQSGPLPPAPVDPATPIIPVPPAPVVPAAPPSIAGISGLTEQRAAPASTSARPRPSFTIPPA